MKDLQGRGRILDNLSTDKKISCVPLRVIDYKRIHLPVMTTLDAEN